MIPAPSVHPDRALALAAVAAHLLVAGRYDFFRDELYFIICGRHPAPKAAETQRQGELPQTFADMHGWRELTRTVTEAMQSLPPEERAQVVILAHNYGEAGALDSYGRGLPPVVCGHNQYGLWGLRGTAPGSIITINRSPEELAPHCSEVRELARFHAPWVMPFEDDSPITLCRGLHPSLAELWPEISFKF